MLLLVAVTDPDAQNELETEIIGLVLGVAESIGTGLVPTVDVDLAVALLRAVAASVHEGVPEPEDRDEALVIGVAVGEDTLKVVDDAMGESVRSGLVPKVAVTSAVPLPVDVGDRVGEGVADPEGMEVMLALSVAVSEMLLEGVAVATGESVRTWLVPKEAEAAAEPLLVAVAETVADGALEPDITAEALWIGVSEVKGLVPTVAVVLEEALAAAVANAVAEVEACGLAEASGDGERVDGGEGVAAAEGVKNEVGVVEKDAVLDSVSVGLLE